MTSSTIKKILLISVMSLGAFILFIPLISEIFLRQYVTLQARRLLNTEVTLGRAEIHPLSFSLSVHQLMIFHPSFHSQPVASIDTLHLKTNLSSLIFHRQIALSLEIENPQLTYTLTPQGRWDLSGKFPLLNRGKNEKRMTPFNVEKIKIHDGKLTYQDYSISSPPTVTKIHSIEVIVKNLQLPEEANRLPTAFESTFDIENEGKFTISGRGDFLSPHINFESDVTLKDISIAQFQPYYQKDLPVTVQGGTLKLTSHAVCIHDMLKAPAHLSISQLKVVPNKNMLFGFAAGSIVASLKNKNGNVELDVTIAGPITNPQFHLSTNLSQAFVKGLSSSLTEGVSNTLGDVGSGVSEGIHSGMEKLKRLFR